MILGEVIETKTIKNNEHGEIHYPILLPKVKYTLKEKTYEVWSDYTNGENFEIGQKIEVYYNIDNPSEIQFKPNEQKTFFLVFIIIGFLIIFLTIWLKYIH